MKTLKWSFLLSIIFLFNNTFAQTTQRLKLSDQYPHANEKITLTYNALGSVLNDKKNITATIYYFNRSRNVDEIDLKPTGKLWTGEVTIADSTKAFVIKLSSADAVDNNNDKGFIYLIYKGKKPVQEAYSSRAFVTLSSRELGLKEDYTQSIADMRREFELYPSSKIKNEDMYYYLLSHSASETDKTLIKQKIASLKNSDKEKDMEFEVSLLQMTRKMAQADSVKEVAIKKFPNGSFAKYKARVAYMQEQNLVKKDSLYNILVKMGSVQDYMTMQLALAYLKEAKFDQYNKYKSMTKDTAYLEGSLNNIAYGWSQFGLHLSEAERLSKETLDITQAKIDHPKSEYFRTARQVKEQYQQVYDTYADTYNYILYQEGKYAEAVKLQYPVWERAKVNSEVNQHYILMLVAANDYAKAAGIIEATIKAGKETDALKDALKKCYVKTKGSEAGYTEYLSSLETIGMNNSKNDLVKEMINQPARVFTLKDINGNVVSLSSLKGKTVIVDFWATWCGPCKASMPGMQMAVNKYKDDPNTIFLFIDTWENGDKYQDGVKQFIADNKYTFNVLLDEKDKDGKQAKVVTQFKVDGIPTKFIIDKNGNIRFKVVGFDGSADNLVSELSTMISLTANPPVSVN